MCSGGGTADVDGSGGGGRGNRECVFGGGEVWSAGGVCGLCGEQGAMETFTVGLAKEVALEGMRVNGASRGG